MNTIIVFVVGFASAILYARGKADPVASLKVDASRFGRWCARKGKALMNDHAQRRD